MHPRDDLLVRLDEPVAHRALRVARRGRCPNVVDAFEEHDVFHPRLSEDVPVEAREDIWAQAVVQDTVPTRSLVEHGDVRRARVGLQPSQNEIWPAVYVYGNEPCCR